MLYTLFLLNGIKIAYNTYNVVIFNLVMYSILISFKIDLMKILDVIYQKLFFKYVITKYLKFNNFQKKLWEYSC